MIRCLGYFAWLVAVGSARAIRAQWNRARWRERAVRIARGVTMHEHIPGAIRLAEGTSIGLGTLLLATHEMSCLPPERSSLQIGHGTAVNEYCNLRASGGEIRIGARCIIAQMVTIVASNHSTDIGRPMMDQPWSAEPHSVWVGDDVWIGAGVTVLPGARIETGAVIAAGAVVRGRVPSHEIWGGVPARFLRRRPGLTAIDASGPSS